MARSVVDQLLRSDEASVRWRTRVSVLGEDPDQPANRRLREQIRTSSAARRLIDGHARLQPKTYSKWRGGHWVLMALADLGFPTGDEDLEPMRDGVLRTWLDGFYFREFDADAGPRTSGVAIVNGRYRQCGSLQGGALLAISRLGIDDGRAASLVERLRHWQWPDGGWNCDRDPQARSSSVYETLIPMRGLAAYARSQNGSDRAGRREASRAARRAAEVMLTRRLLFRRSTGQLIHGDWAKLHFPVYWHYDVLAALKGIAEAGLIDDPRCGDGLELLERKQLPGGGWAAEAKFYQPPTAERGTRDHVDWGGVKASRMNEWVTVDALTVLAAAGRRPVSA
jgi:hypothetical protein